MLVGIANFTFMFTLVANSFKQKLETKLCFHTCNTARRIAQCCPDGCPARSYNAIGWGIQISSWQRI